MQCAFPGCLAMSFSHAAVGPRISLPEYLFCHSGVIIDEEKFALRIQLLGKEPVDD
jgi:hypothetical protein